MRGLRPRPLDDGATLLTNYTIKIADLQVIFKKYKKLFVFESLCDIIEKVKNVPVVQRIGLRIPVPSVRVRFLPGTPNSKTVAMTVFFLGNYTKTGACIQRTLLYYNGKYYK